MVQKLFEVDALALNLTKHWVSINQQHKPLWSSGIETGIASISEALKKHSSSGVVIADLLISGASSIVEIMSPAQDYFVLFFFLLLTRFNPRPKDAISTFI